MTSIRLRGLVPAIVAMVVVGCGGITLGELDQYAVNYKITVKNTSPGGTASVGIHIEGSVARGAQLRPGESIDVTSLKGGAWTVSVTGTQTRKEALRSVQAGLVQALDALKPGQDLPDVLRSQITSTDQLIASASGDSGGAPCHGTMKDPGGDTVSLIVSVDFGGGSGTGNWYCYG